MCYISFFFIYFIIIFSPTHTFNRDSSIMLQIPNVPDSAAAHRLPFLNVLLHRLFCDMKDSKLFYNDIYCTLVTAFHELNKPDFVMPITVDTLELGSSFVCAHSVKLIKTKEANEMIGEFDLEYTGGLGLDLTTGLYLKGQTFPVKAKVRVMQVAGKAQLYAGKERQV
jgi:hypothetical protein